MLLLRLIRMNLPQDHSRQRNAWQLAEPLLRARPVQTVLDLGCGDGNSADRFQQAHPGIRWVGVDIEASPEVSARTRSDVEFHTFDGVHLPFAADSFPLVFSNQVFEHVRNPPELLAEVRRVLQPGGLFVGSTSHLEPFHSYSFGNFTPYGFKVLVEAAGLELVEIRPSIDSLTLIVRRLLGMPKLFDRWWDRESPLNRVISLRGRLKKESVVEVNAMKLLFCGQFSFICRKTK
jgi:SAM-dependent methyltransferase